MFRTKITALNTARIGLRSRRRRRCAACAAAAVAVLCLWSGHAFASDDPGRQGNDVPTMQTAIRVKLSLWPMVGSNGRPFIVDGIVGATTEFRHGDASDLIEWIGFTPSNLVDLATAPRLRSKNGDTSIDVGPSVTYRLGGEAGRDREFLSYLQPMTVDGEKVYLAGMRRKGEEEFNFLRVPADANGSLREWTMLRVALADPALRTEAAHRYARLAAPRGSDGAVDHDMIGQLATSAEKLVELFAGSNRLGNADVQSVSGGYEALKRFLAALPSDDQEKAARLSMKMLKGIMWELWQSARAKAGELNAAATQPNQHFVDLATQALSDSFFYPATFCVTLDSKK
jgi:cytochrome c biogenesis protein